MIFFFLVIPCLLGSSDLKYKITKKQVMLIKKMNIK